MDTPKKVGRADLTKAVLLVVKTAGILSIAAVAPGALKALALFDDRGRLRSRTSYIKNEVIAKLLKRDLIKLVKNPQGQTHVSLTASGENELMLYELGEKGIKKPKRWDGKYRLIIFDIKEGKRGKRDELRLWLADLGFVKLQNSVWVYPYECREIVVLLKAHFRIGQEILYITADNIENDRWLKKEFDLA